MALKVIEPFYEILGFERNGATLSTRSPLVMNAVWNRRTSPFYEEVLVRTTFTTKLGTARDVRRALKSEDSDVARAALRAPTHIARATAMNQLARVLPNGNRRGEVVMEASISSISIERKEDKWGGVLLCYSINFKKTRRNADGVMRVEGVS